MIEVTRGNSPIVLGFAHSGTEIPADVGNCLNAAGRAMADTDWHIDRLYKDLGLDLTRVRTPVHRYVIDVNRSAQDEDLYPGLNTTGLCPVTDFDGLPIYNDGQEPDKAEIARRTALYHAPYHAAMQSELERVRDKYGAAILFDCHSIRSVIPYLFENTLPDFNIGTDSSTSCSLSVERSVHMRCRAAMSYSTALNERFKGGFTVRNYGQPSDHIHAIQLELAQSTYMNEAAPWAYRPDKAERLRPVIYRILSDLVELVHERQIR